MRVFPNLLGAVACAEAVAPKNFAHVLFFVQIYTEILYNVKVHNSVHLYEGR